MRWKFASALTATVLVAAALVAPLPAAAAPPLTVCDAPDFTKVGGGSQRVEALSGDVTLLTAGTYTGELVLHAGGTVCVAADAALNPRRMERPAGDLIVLGDARLPSMISRSGFSLVVDGDVEVGSLVLDGSSELVVKLSGTLSTDTLEVNSGALVDNAGALDAVLQADAGSTVLNSGQLTTHHGLTFRGALRNTGKILVTGGVFEVAPGATMSNQCVIDAPEGVTVAGNDASGVTNAGIIRALGSRISVETHGGYTQTSAGITVADGLENHGVITGFGQFRFSGHTHVWPEAFFEGDSFGQPIVVDDLTHESPPPQIFDHQEGRVDNTRAGRVDNPPPDATVGTCASEVPVADLVVTKTGPATVPAGGTVTYTITVHNAGPDAASGVTVTDTLPPELTNVSASGGGVVGGGNVTWTPGSMANRADVVFTVTGTAPASGTFVNYASATSGTTDPIGTNNDGSTPAQFVPTEVVALPPANLPPVVRNAVVYTHTGQTVAGVVDISDPDVGQQVTATKATEPVNGTATVTGDGVFEYHPTGTLTGVDKFTVEGCDNADPSACDTGTVFVVVSPLAVHDSAETFMDTPVTIPVVTNDLGDLQGGPFVASPPSSGTVAAAGEEMVYTPFGGFVGADVFEYRICSNPITVCSSAAVSVLVESPNQPPVASDTAVSGPADTPVSGRVVTSDPDVGQTVEVKQLTVPAAGTVVVNPDGAFTFTPPANTSDVFTFSVLACDSHLASPLCDTALVTATITPVAGPDSATTTAGTSVTFSLTANDLGGVGAPTLVAPPGPANGTVTIGADGQATYAPNAGFTGEDTFQYTVCATAEPILCDTGTTTVQVNPAPLPPVTVQDETLTTTATVPVSKVLTSNLAAADLTFTVPTAPSNGAAIVTPTGLVTYTPTGTFTGRDQFVVLACAKAEPANCDTATITVTVAPFAADDVATVMTGSSVDITVGANDIGTVSPPQSLSTPVNGTAGVSGTSVTYTPDPGFVGTDTFTYTICSTVDVDVCSIATVTVTVTEPPNQAPVAQDTAVTGPASAPVSGQVSASDPDTAQTLTYSLVTPPTAGSAVVDAADGSFTFTPPTNIADVFTFVVEVCDDHADQLCDTATVTATITPVARPDVKITTEDTPRTFSLTANDRGGVGAPTVVTNPANGTVVIGGDEQVTYSPGAGFTGLDTFTYQVCATADTALCDTGSAYVLVAQVPLPPVAVEDEALTTTATNPVVVDLRYNLASTDLTFTVSAAPTNGTAAVTASGRVTYTPTGTYVGRDQFSVQACATAEPANCDTATIAVTVNPVAGDDVATVQAGSSVDIPVGTNDVGTVTAPQDLSDPANGTAVVSGTSVTYTPDAGFVGTDTFTYTICSTVDVDVCATATVTVTVTEPPNQAPVAQDAAVTGPADTAVAGQISASDPDADQTLSYSVLTPPPDGTAVVDTAVGSFTFTPPTDTSDVFTFVVQVCDDHADQLCDTATVTATITPVAHPDSASTTAGVPVTFPLTSNDRGGVGTPTVFTPPTDGTVTIGADGRATYTPAAGFTGDDTFTYRVCATADTALCTTATATVHVDPAPLPPVAVQDESLTTTATAPVTVALTFNHDAADLTFTVSAQAADGTANVAPAGDVTYTPTGEFTGRDQFTVQACSVTETANCDTATITVTVLPVAGNDTATVVAGRSVDIAVGTNDVGTTGPPQDLSNPPGGSAVVSGAAVTYTADAGFVGTDTFAYTICSTVDLDVCATATVTVTVTEPANQAPVAQDAAVTGPADVPVSGQVSASDPDGEPLAFTLLTPPPAGTAVVNADGSFTFTPPDNTADVFTFGVQVCDDHANQLCDTATVTATITPVVQADTATTTQNTPVTFSLTANDRGGVGAPTPGLPPGPSNGFVTMSPDGTATYTPNPGFTGQDIFHYRVCATAEPTLCAVAPATIQVSAAPLPPVAGQDENVTTTATVPVVVDLTFNYEGTDLTFTVSVPAEAGVATVDADGRATYTPTGGFTGLDQFTVQACLTADTANCGTAVVTVTVNPVAGDDVATVVTGISVDIPVKANDVGTVGPPQDLSNPPGGSAVVSGAAVTYTADAGFVGTDTFAYTICSTVDLDVCATATVTVTVTEPANQAPVAQDAAVTGPADVPVSGQVSASDPDGEPLAFTLLTPPPAGTAVVNADGSFTFTPPDNTADVFTFGVQVCDDHANQLCDTATVTATITPVVQADTATTTQNTPVTFSLTANDRGGVGAPTPGLPPGPSNGFVTMSPDGTATYTPNPGFTGQDIFHYRVCATAEPTLCAVAPATIQVSAAPLPPVAVQDEALTTTATLPVFGYLTFNLASFHLTFTVSVPAANGAATVDATGSVSYTPTGEFVGRDQFTVQACALAEPTNCDTAVVTITVAPLAGDDVATVNAGVGVFIPVDANDLGTVSPPQDLSDPANGTAVVSGTAVTYTPDAGFVGTDTFAYTICSTVDVDVCATATVTVTVVIGVLATADVLSTEAGVTGTVNILVNDTAGDASVATIMDAPVNGTASIDGPVLTYTPTGTFTGHDVLSYAVCAPTGPPACDQALVLIEVSPDVRPNLTTTPESTAITIDVAANDFGDAGPAVVTRPPAHGTVTGGSLELVLAVLSTGTAGQLAAEPLIYTPDPGYVGPDSFQYARCAPGSTSLCSQTVVAVLVTPVAEPTTPPPTTPPPTTPPPTTPPPTAPTPGPTPVHPSAPPTHSGALSATGTNDVGPLLLTGLVLIGLGTLSVLVARRRHG